ncbi:hypothetical protein [Moorena sp. SIO3B2]|uniref:hypothetical protein n=1 Tax=Moorena sp. SIO3B2 TaxID=2607827 RepID=UPI0013C79451|nr:hypothetical protein [Moorena sp. SIO3B2]NEP36139.1 hypothetical protein [Moorena sp. SIO3B2]
MSLNTWIETTYGQFCVFVNDDAAKKALAPLNEYTERINGDYSSFISQGTQSSSTIDKIGAGASVVGAIAGIAGLASSGQNNEDTLEIEVINYLSNMVTPYEFKTTRCCIRESPRCIRMKDHSLMKFSWADGFNDDSEVTVSFKVGPFTLDLEKGSGFSSGIPVELTLGYVSDDSYWQLKSVTVDGVNSGSMHYQSSSKLLYCVSFTRRDETTHGWERFNVFYHEVQSKTAKSYIAFTPITPIGG